MKLAKTGHGPHSSKLVVICVVLLLFVLFYVLFVCKCVLYSCHRVTTQLHLTNVSFESFSFKRGINTTQSYSPCVLCLASLKCAGRLGVILCVTVRRLRAHFRLARYKIQGDYEYVVLIFRMKANSSQLIYIYIYNYGTGSYQDRNVIDVCTQGTTGRENTVIYEEYYCFTTMDDQCINRRLSYFIYCKF